MKKKKIISVIIPVYFSEKIIDELCNRLHNSLTKITDSFEIILVDDSSPDNSWNKIKEMLRNTIALKVIF